MVARAAVLALAALQAVLAIAAVRAFDVALESCKRDDLLKTSVMLEKIKEYLSIPARMCSRR